MFYEVLRKMLKGKSIKFNLPLGYGNPKLAIRYVKRVMKDGENKKQVDIAFGSKVYESVEKLSGDLL